MNPSNGVGFLLETFTSTNPKKVQRWLDEQRQQAGCVGWRTMKWTTVSGYGMEHVAQVVWLDRKPYRREGRTFAWLTGDLYAMFNMEHGRSYYGSLAS